MASGFHIRNAETPDDRARVQTLLQTAFEVRPGVGAAFAQVYAQNDQLLGFCAQSDACVLLGAEAFARCCWNAQTLAVYEAAALTHAAAVQLHDALHAWAQMRGCVHLAIHLPPDNRLAQAATARNAIWTVGEDAELLVKVLDVQSLMQAMKAVLSRRIEQAQWKGMLDLCVGNARVKVGQKREGWRVSLSETGFARALLGLGRLSAQVDSTDEALKKGLDALFPERYPFFWLADSF